MMESTVQPRERFRKGFVLVMTLAYTTMFFAMIWGFVEALLLAAVFSGILYPLYLWFNKVFKGRSTPASLVTLLIAMLVIIIPVIFLMGLVAEQAVEVATTVEPWVEQQINESSVEGSKLPEWIPYADKLEPYREQISTKLSQFTESAAVYLGGSLARITQGTMVFFLNLFIMLYAMFFFLMSGPQLIQIIMSYLPLSQGDRDKMLQVGLSVSRATIKGTLIIGAIQGALGGIGFAVAGIGSAVFWGAVMAVLSVLPGIGATLVWAPAVAYLLLTGDEVTGILLMIWCAGVVGTIDNVLRPMLVGRDTEMPDLLILLATLGGLTMFGVSGLVLGPILAALFITVLAIYSRVFEDWLNG
ncbi:MAG: AI-2E family transporter [Xanthomonadales bacterium]|nr:AI-2E family transporter [Xanthomonadales bacterium]